MWKLFLAVAAMCCAGAASAQGSHYVRGYEKADGTYVAPHYQTNPNGTTLDNWSTKGNVNPYTGQPGTRSPTYEAPTYARPAYGQPDTRGQSSYGQPVQPYTGSSYGTPYPNPY